MDKHKTELTENEKKQLTELIKKWNNDPRTDQNYLRYREHQRKMETKPLYRAKWFFKTTVYACADLCKYLIMEKLFRTKTNRRS